MNVLIVTVLQPHAPSGVVTYYQTLAKDLAGEGVRAQVIDSSGTPWLWRRFLGMVRRLMRLFGNGGEALYHEFADFVSMYMAIKLANPTLPDVIHAQDPKSGAATFLALGKRVPVVLTCHFNDDPVVELLERYEAGSRSKGLLNKWYSYLFSHINNYVFVSDYTYAKTRHLLPDTVNKVIIRNTVGYTRSAERHQDVQTDRLIISNVGFVDERKNQKLLIQIGSKLYQRGLRDFMIWIIGDGPKRSEYEQLAGEFGIAEQVHFYGRQQAPWKLVEQSDIYVHTATNDNCPYSIIEAFAVQTPVLALPVGGIPEMLPDGYGLLHGTAPDQLADEIATYFDPARRQELTQQQRRYANQHFNHGTSLSRLVSFYQQTRTAA